MSSLEAKALVEELARVRDEKWGNAFEVFHIYIYNIKFMFNTIAIMHIIQDALYKC